MKIWGITGWKNTGKTGLTERLVAEFTARGLRVSTIKHGHHSAEVDRPGSDSFRHRAAGAVEVVLATPARVAAMQELRDAPEPKLADLIARLRPVDLVLIEGYKRADHPKIETHRARANKDLLATGDPTIQAVASNTDLDLDRPVFDLDDTPTIADFIALRLGFTPSQNEQTRSPAPPPMRNDCFALPAGVDWVPVDEALAHLQSAMQCRVVSETCPLDAAEGRLLAEPVTALHSNPPHANSAVDGYGFAGGRPDGVHNLPLVATRAAAGDAAHPVPDGQAIRILTGAMLPPGVDTVILQEDVTAGDREIAFRGPVKPGANTRRAGEDVAAGTEILPKGRRLTSADLALVAATGHGTLPVYAKLRVGVVSTGDELRAAGSTLQPGQVYDANRPMLLSLLAKWGCEPVDLGHVPDNRDMLRERLDEGAAHVDAILTSGGASAGDEDHVSALLEEADALQMWRIAVKPGRPLALGLWQGCPVFGLPGNPVAAMVCSLIFARPSLAVLAGQDWHMPQGFDVPTAFSKTKKPGRREYLRARIRDGAVEIFQSEGSGRISGLSWAEGLVELPDHAVTISPGDLVRYLPFSSFGL